MKALKTKPVTVNGQKRISLSVTDEDFEKYNIDVVRKSGKDIVILLEEKHANR